MPALPPPPAASFASDNAAGAVPEAMAALAAANEGPALAYGDDPWTAAADAAVRELFGVDATVTWCWGGTGANVVALASVLRPWEAVITPDTAHIVVDEAGAPVRFTGASLLPVPAVHGKLTPAGVQPFLDWQGTVHHPQPRVLSISQTTEAGTVYALDELRSLTDLAHRHEMLVHVDGARLANAVAATETSVADMVTAAGVDVVTLGLTKAGAMYGEAVVHLRPELGEHAPFVRKQAGQLPSKARFVAAQASALLADDAWIRHAAHANAMARRLAEAVAGIDGVELVAPPAANAVFARIPWQRYEALSAWSFFWPWDPAEGVVRWMTSWATQPDDVDAFAAGVAAVVGGVG
ncbi:MAG: aminotransferase class V-fold PLP-dependent enzyme [Acidimicrobiales bacterium]|nr:aminotransferase class V-fold PLP-dependent enzyme [Acidimicrobiales bacterium]